MALDPRRDPHARIVVKPLPSQVRAAKAAGAGAASGAGAGAGEHRVPGAGGVAVAAGAAVRSEGERDPFLRPANEDDDGYDPYSDRPAPREPLFQEDPWN